MPRLRALAVHVTAEPTRPVTLVHAGGDPILVTASSTFPSNVDAIEDETENKVVTEAKQALEDARQTLEHGKQIILTAARDIVSHGFSEFELVEQDPHDVKAENVGKVQDVPKGTPVPAVSQPESNKGIEDEKDESPTKGEGSTSPFVGERPLGPSTPSSSSTA